ncbi:glycosyltransferase [Agromyces sp. GXQ0307]|uniref:glycosyltransferase n=1 Tax=Agromyces sp. GXQ0307 TaxID=3377835 RepID=UPI00383B6C30
MSGRPHLLYTAWGFPPSRAGGVYRALATVNAFAERDWDVTVLTTARETFLDSTGGDVSLERRIHPDVRLERLSVDTPAFSSDLARWSRARARYPELWVAADWRRDLVRFPERAYGRWRPDLERAARRVHRERRVSLAVGTANPHVDFTPGWALHRDDGVPFVMDYRDAWRLDVFSGRTLHERRSRVGRWEHRLQNAAEEVWFVNDPIARWHAERNPDASARMQIVANGFDEYDVPLRVPVRADRGDGLTFGYIGTVSENVPIEPLLSGWRRAREESELLRRSRLVLHGYLGHFGASGSASEALARAAADGVHFAGPVSKATIGEVYGGFDVLVLALGTGRYVTSGKVYEYAATGIPIVSIHEPVNAATDVLRDSPAWVPTRSLASADVAAALTAVAARAEVESDADRAAAQEWARQFERSHQLAARIDHLRDVVDARSAGR